MTARMIAEELDHLANIADTHSGGITLRRQIALSLFAELRERRTQDLSTATELETARAEIQNLRQFIAASKECADGVAIAEMHEENERVRTVFKQFLARMQTDANASVRFASCSWCDESWPHLEGTTVEEARQYAREHGFRCAKHPLRIERDAIRVERDRLQLGTASLESLIEIYTGDLQAERKEVDRLKGELRTATGCVGFPACQAGDDAHDSACPAAVGEWVPVEVEHQRDSAREELERMRPIYAAAIRYYRATLHDGPDDEHGVFTDTIQHELAKECSSNECQIREKCTGPWACRSFVMLRSIEG